MEKLYTGLDVSKDTLAVYIMHPNGDKYAAFEIANSPLGCAQVSHQIVAAMEKFSLTSVKIGFEATSVYGDNLVYYFRQDEVLSAYHLEIYELNARMVAKQKDALGDLPKNDPIDAYVVAECLRIGRIGRPDRANELTESLSFLTRARFHTVQALVREKANFTNHLFHKFSGLTQVKVFSDTFGAASLALIEEFATVDDIVNMSLDELANFLIKKSHNQFDNPEEIAQAVKMAINNSYRLPQAVNATVHQLLCISAAAIRAHEKTIKAYDDAISKIVEIVPNTLRSVPGVGPVYSAGILAEVGNVSNYGGEASLAKYAGLVWKQHQSGSFTAENTSLSFSGNKYLKYYLCEAANSLRRCDPDYKAFYRKKFNEVNKHQHKRALALTARKFVRLVFRLLKDQCLYKSPVAA